MKLLVFDIDNTILVRGDEHLTKEVANTISACLKKGYAVCFASGRPFTGVKKYLDEVGPGLKFAITANGAALYKEDGTLIKEVYMTPSECYKLHDEYQNAHCTVYAYDDYGGLITFSDDHWTKYELEVNNFNKHYEFDKEDYRNSNVKIYKVMIADDEEYSKNFSLTKEELKIYNPSRSTVNYYEVLRFGAGKTNPMRPLRYAVRSRSFRCPTSSSPSQYLPSVGLSSSPRIFSNVDLPQPEGPMMATNSPSFTSILTPLSAIVSTSSVRKILVMFSVLIISCFFVFSCCKVTLLLPNHQDFSYFQRWIV